MSHSHKTIFSHEDAKKTNTDKTAEEMVQEALNKATQQDASEDTQDMDLSQEMTELHHKLEELQKENEDLKTKSEENWRKFLESMAEKDNEKKRLERDFEQRKKFAVEKLTAELLPVMDTLERAEETAQELVKKNELNAPVGLQAMQEGIQLTIKIFEDILSKNGVQSINPHLAPFNPQHHEAMSMIENHELENNTVSNVVQKGYLLNDRLIRPARVIVNKKNE